MLNIKIWVYVKYNYLQYIKKLFEKKEIGEKERIYIMRATFDDKKSTYFILK